MQRGTHFLGVLLLVFGAAACDDSTSPAPGTDSGTTDGGATGLDMDGTDPDVGGGGEDGAVEMDGPIVEEDGAVGPDGAVEDTLCQACEDDDDCAGEGSRCIEVGGENVCGTACADDDGCEDGFECAEFDDGDQCVPTGGSCSDCEDADGDGYGVGAGCLGTDCDEENMDVHSGVATDGCDGVDNDCDDSTDEDFEAAVCGAGACQGTSSCDDGVETECVEGDPAENDATCDGVDDDCDDSVDEDYESVACGFGACANVSSCADGVETECEPLDVAAADDATCDGADDDCDDSIDEDFVGEQCGVGACAAVGACVEGAPMCVENDPVAADDATCDGVDDDCDESTDEDYDGSGEAACGFGVCRRDAACEGGEVACTPGEPEAEVDDTCDGVDQDCDGRVDDECNANALGFAVSDQGADFVNVDVVYEQEAPPGMDNAQSRPRVIQLRVLYPAALTLVEDGMPAIVRGPPVVEAQKQLQIFEQGPGELRIIIISADNSNRIGPGTLITMRFNKNGAASPWAFSWNEDRTTFAPEEANDILTMQGADLE